MVGEDFSPFVIGLNPVAHQFLEIGFSRFLVKTVFFGPPMKIQVREDINQVRCVNVVLVPGWEKPAIVSKLRGIGLRRVIRIEDCWFNVTLRKDIFTNSQDHDSRSVLRNTEAICMEECRLGDIPVNARERCPNVSKNLTSVCL